MKRFRRLFAGALIGAVLVMSVGLSGCIGPGKEGALQLPAPKITSPQITQEGTLRVGVDSSHVPFAGSSDGQIIGIDVDIAAALAEELGLKLEIIDIQGQDISALLRDGTIDVAMGVQDSSSTTATTQTFTEVQVGPYLIDGPAAFTVSYASDAVAFDTTQLTGARTAAQEGSLSAWQIGKDFGDANLQTYPTLNGAFDSLIAGETSYVAADAIVGSFLAVKYTDVNCVGLIANPLGVYMGVATDKTELATTLTDALRTIRDNGSLQIIIAKWLGPVSAQTVSSNQAIVSLTGVDSTTESVVTTEEPESVPEETGEEVLEDVLQ
jgi:polar amino acid transport system substrate-binding protein